LALDEAADRLAELLVLLREDEVPARRGVVRLDDGVGAHGRHANGERAESKQCYFLLSARAGGATAGGAPPGGGAPPPVGRRGPRARPERPAFPRHGLVKAGHLSARPGRRSGSVLPSPATGGLTQDACP